MKTRIVIFVLLGLGAVHGQTATEFQRSHGIPTEDTPLSGEEWRLRLVARLMLFSSPVTNGVVQLHGMGDEAAVDVLKVMAGKPPLTSGEIGATLDIVHMAFEQPVSIISPFNKQPRAASFLFQYLSSTVTDVAVKERIAKEAKFAQVAALPVPPKPSEAPKQ